MSDQSVTDPMNKYLKQRKHLFEIYSKNLAAYVPQYQGLYGCPLCLKLYQESAVADERLTGEHTVPKLLKGKIETLTCRSCNNTLGSQIDRHLCRKVELDDFFTGGTGRPLEADLTIGEHRLAADLLITEDGLMKFSIIGKATHPNAIHETQRQGKAGDLPEEITFRYEHYSERRAKLARLKSAYLKMFRILGYGYILHGNLQPIRDQLLKPDEEIVPLDVAVAGLEETNFYHGVYVGIRPKELRAFVVPLKMRREHGKTYFNMVVMPGLDDADDTYERYASAKERHGNRLNTTFHRYKFSEGYLVDPPITPVGIWKQEMRLGSPSD